MTDWPGRRNYSLNETTILRDLYRLASMFLGDRPLILTSTDDNDPLRRLRERFVEDELVHLLVGTAVANRIHLEHMSGPRNDPNELSFAPIDDQCGQFRRNVNAYPVDWQTLGFREACNKIVHANNIVVRHLPSPDGSVVEPSLTEIVSLRGEQNGQTWLAHLNVLQYVRVSVLNFDDAC